MLTYLQMSIRRAQACNDDFVQEAGKGWPLQLLAVACLSIAAKMEETNVPLLLDLQILEPRFLFKPSTVQRMEILVMARLKWRLHIITPFDFLHYFIEKLSCPSSNFNGSIHSVLSRSSDLIISILRGNSSRRNLSVLFLPFMLLEKLKVFMVSSTVINFLDYTPSSIGAAAVLWVTNQTMDDPKLGCLHKRVNKVSAFTRRISCTNTKLIKLMFCP